MLAGAGSCGSSSYVTGLFSPEVDVDIPMSEGGVENPSTEGLSLVSSMVTGVPWVEPDKNTLGSSSNVTSLLSLMNGSGPLPSS